MRLSPREPVEQQPRVPGGAKKDWMAGAVKHPGGLHRALGVPLGQKIPVDRVESATHSSDPHLRRMASLAETFSKFRGP